MKNLFLIVLLLSGTAGLADEKSDLTAFLKQADAVVLFSIVPQQTREVDEHGNPSESDRMKERLHGFPVLGRVTETDAATRTIIRNALLKTLSSVKPGPPNLCFEPRHAACLKRGGKHIDLIICFECAQAEIRQMEILGSGEVRLMEKMIPIGIEGRDALNRLLEAKKIERDIPAQKQEMGQPASTNPLG